MKVKIYRPSKTAMSSGRAKTKKWILEFIPSLAKSVEPLMGWTSTRNTQNQVCLNFENKEDAIAYAVRKGYSYVVHDKAPRKRRVMAYSDNFKTNRVTPWTH